MLSRTAAVVRGTQTENSRIASDDPALIDALVQDSTGDDCLMSLRTAYVGTEKVHNSVEALGSPRTGCLPPASALRIFLRQARATYPPMHRELNQLLDAALDLPAAERSQWIEALPPNCSL